MILVGSYDSELDLARWGLCFLLQVTCSNHMLGSNAARESTSPLVRNHLFVINIAVDIVYFKIALTWEPVLYNSLISLPGEVSARKAKQYPLLGPTLVIGHFIL